MKINRCSKCRKVLENGEWAEKDTENMPLDCISDGMCPTCRKKWLEEEGVYE